MGTKSSLVPKSTRDRDGDAHHDDITLFSLLKENYGLTFMITFIVLKKFPTRNEMNEMNEFSSWKRHEVSKVLYLNML
jgi:hypothetical protein